MKILLLGKNGQVGRELQRSLAPLGEVIAPGRDDTTSLCGDLTRSDLIRATVRQVKPQVIVNAAAYTAVDNAEREPTLAWQVNALGPAVLAQEAARLGAWLVQYSTDYVFNGSGSRPWHEDDCPDPLNTYGRSKWAAEQAIHETGCRHLIFRTSWVYSARGQNFARTVLRLARERDHLSVVNDQIGAPTSADLIADITAHAVYHVLHTSTSGQPPSRLLGLSPEPQDSSADAASPLSCSGTYHLAAGGETSWFGYARYLLEEVAKRGVALKVASQHIEPVSSEAFPTRAQRPLNSRLNTCKLQRTFNLYLPPWQSGLQRFLDTVFQ